MTPTLGGTIDPTFFARYDATVQAALSSGSDVFVIVDLVRLQGNGLPENLRTDPFAA